MSLDQHISLTIKVSNSGIARFGFGLIGIISHKSVFTARSKLYSRTADMVTDGFPADSVEVLTATRILGQSPHPPNVLVLRADGSAVVQKYTIVATPKVSTKYEMKIDGEGFAETDLTYTSGATTALATAAAIHNSLLTQLNAVTSKNYTATFDPLVLTPIVFTATNADEIFHAAAHGLKTGDGPIQVSNSGGALPAGLAAVTDYYVIRIDANTFYLATSLALALAGTHLLISTDGTGTQTLSSTVSTVRPDSEITMTGSAPGNWFSPEMIDTDLIEVTQTHTAFGVAAELDAILKKDKTWYWIASNFNSKAYVLEVAAWAEANGPKMYVVDNNDSDCAQKGLGDTPNDMQAALSLLGYKRTEYKYHQRPGAMTSAGYMGLLAPKNVGLWTGKFKTIVGVEPTPLNSDQTANILARKANGYTAEAGRNITWEGSIANTDYAFTDVTVSLDWVADDLVKALFGVLVSIDKVGYDDDDIQRLVAAGQSTILRAVSDEHKIMARGVEGSAEDPPPSISFPKVADIDPSTRALRELPDGELNFRLDGAVHKIFVTATVTF